jgi:hypothetical protein
MVLARHGRHAQRCAEEGNKCREPHGTGRVINTMCKDMPSDILAEVIDLIVRGRDPRWLIEQGLRYPNTPRSSGSEVIVWKNCPPLMVSGIWRAPTPVKSVGVFEAECLPQGNIEPCDRANWIITCWNQCPSSQCTTDGVKCCTPR